MLFFYFLTQTRTGVYCPGRANLHAKPFVPRAFSYIAHEAAATAGTDGDLGELSTLSVSADYDKKYFRSRYTVKGERIELVDDQNTGIRYRINRSAGTCELRTLGNSEEGYDPEHLFRLDLDPKPQFAGQVYNEKKLILFYDNWTEIITFFKENRAGNQHRCLDCATDLSGCGDCL